LTKPGILVDRDILLTGNPAMSCTPLASPFERAVETVFAEAGIGLTLLAKGPESRRADLRGWVESDYQSDQQE
jgi:hypothetical protein